MSMILNPYRFAAASNGLDAKVVHSWLFEDASGNPAATDGGTALTVGSGTGLVYQQTGKLGSYALTVDPTQGDFLSATGLTYASGGAWSLSAWMRLRSTGSAQELLATHFAANERKYLHWAFLGGWKINLALDYNTENVSYAASQDTNWHLFGITANVNSSTSHTWELVFDGTVVDTFTGDPTADSDYDATVSNRVVLGAMLFNNNLAYDVDEIVVYDSVLDATDWSNLWNSGSGLSRNDFD